MYNANQTQDTGNTPKSKRGKPRTKLSEALVAVASELQRGDINTICDEVELERITVGPYLKGTVTFAETGMKILKAARAIIAKRNKAINDTLKCAS